MTFDDCEPEWMVCQICAQPLNALTSGSDKPVQYLHSSAPRTDDHAPVPVPRQDATVVMCCDFCSSRDAAWIYPTKAPIANILAVETRRATTKDHNTMRDHTVVRQRMTGHEELRENRFSAEWAACDDCSKLIDRYDANALASRVSKLLPSRPPQNLLRRLYRDVLRAKQAKRSIE